MPRRYLKLSQNPFNFKGRSSTASHFPACGSNNDKRRALSASFVWIDGFLKFSFAYSLERRIVVYLANATQRFQKRKTELILYSQWKWILLDQQALFSSWVNKRQACLKPWILWQRFSNEVLKMCVWSLSKDLKSTKTLRRNTVPQRKIIFDKATTTSENHYCAMFLKRVNAAC